jgi:hypothetical protein
MNAASPTVSATRLRIGILLFVLWWLPVYLAVPAVAAALGDTGNAEAVKRIAIVIIGAQSIIGLAGVILMGKEFALMLKRVKYRKMPGTIWRILWTGRAEIPEPPPPEKGK